MDAALATDGAMTNLQSRAGLVVDPAAVSADGAIAYREEVAVQNPRAAATAAALAAERGTINHERQDLEVLDDIAVENAHRPMVGEASRRAGLIAVEPTGFDFQRPGVVDGTADSATHPAGRLVGSEGAVDDQYGRAAVSIVIEGATLFAGDIGIEKAIVNR